MFKKFIDNRKQNASVEPDKPSALNRRQILLASCAGVASCFLTPYAFAKSDVVASGTILDKPFVPPDKRFWYGDNILQFGDWRKPAGEGPFPLAIVIHGGYWRNKYGLDYFGRACEALRQAGIATWSIEFRRVGDEGGSYPGTFLDVAKAIDFVASLEFKRETGNSVDLNNIVVIGHSAGGHLGVWAAARDQIPKTDPLWTENPLKLKGVVSLAGVHSLEYASQQQLSNSASDELMNGSAKDFPDRFHYASPINLLPINAYITLIHGTADTNVPLELSTQYLEAAKGAPNVKYIEIDGADHFHIVDPDSFCWKIIEQSTWDIINA